MSPPSAKKPTPPTDGIGELIERALAEDAADRDVTTLATVPAEATGRARLIAREDAIVAGLDAFEAVFTRLDPTVKVVCEVHDGASVGAGGTVATLDGSMRAILTGERTALNLIQRLSGIATLTRSFVDAAAPVTILDTRKTTPGMRALEKAAVRAGGAANHRANLAEAILIKDNHLAVSGSVARAVKAAVAAADGRRVQVECDSLDQVRDAVDAGAESVLLDNMDVELLREAVALVAGRAATEASGGITLDTVADIAATGVDAISVGALTHSAPAVDLALEVEA